MLGIGFNGRGDTITSEVFFWTAFSKRRVRQSSRKDKWPRVLCRVVTMS